MSTPWFIAPPPSWSGKTIALPQDESHHALRVLRVSPPDVITVTDGRGKVARCAAARVEDDVLVAEILDVETQRAPRPRMAVYQGAAKGSKVDDVIEKLAELGVAEVSVYESERTVVNWDRTKLAKLSSRWDSITRAAAKQSRNAYVTKTQGGLSFTELVRRIAGEPCAIVLWEEATLPLRTALVDMAERVALVVGPEGGLTREEANALADAGAQLVSLGPVILRTENAALVAVSALLYHYGLIG